LVLSLWAFVRWSCYRRNFGRALVGAAILATLVAIFYLEEDWRGKRAWENCKRELTAKGAVLDWNAYIPPPVPDDQNFFTASTNIALRFIKSRNEAESEQARRVQIQFYGGATNPFPIFDNTNPKGKPLVLVEVKILPPGRVIPELNKNSLFFKLNDPAARGEAGDFIQKEIGRSFMGCAGFRFSEFQLSNLPPAQILVQADTPPSISELAYLFRTDTVTNIGRLQIEANGNKGDFRVLLTGVKITAAADYLKWSDQFVPDFDEVRAALKRPYAMIPGDYSQSFLTPIPNFVTMRAFSQVLAQRAQCDLFLSQPDQALHELKLIHDLCRILSRPPAGKPITLVEAMINVAITGLYVQTVEEGMQLHAWQEPQLAVLQEQLREINLAQGVVAAFQTGRAATINMIEKMSGSQMAEMYRVADAIYNTDFWTKLMKPMFLFMKLAPRGWIYQNLLNCVVIESKSLDGFDLEHDTLSPRIFDEVDHNQVKLSEHRFPFNLYAAIALPRVVKATQTLAYNQTLANEAQIVCALERYKLAHGEYPEMLDTLVPQFMERIPRDLIGEQPLHYRRTEAGKFLLYSVGWNETDDGGRPGDLADPKKGDWVWHYSTQ
jgi:hypothetical protein